MSQVLPSHNMLGMRLDYAESNQFIDSIIAYAKIGTRGYCCVANVHMCVLAHDDLAMADKINAATFVLPDSVILQRARALRHRTPFTKTLRGAEIMMELCARAEAQNIQVALVGGKSAADLNTLEVRLAARFPKLSIAYSVAPPFRKMTDHEDQETTNALARSNAQLIFVGLGCPKQEVWMADHTDQLEAMLIGVGAAFDFNAGIVKSSPSWVHQFGLEWLYRLVREPSRLWRRYLTTSPRFLWLLMLDAFKHRGNSA